jgi:Type II secretion system (T2SS), protein F
VTGRLASSELPWPALLLVAAALLIWASPGDAVARRLLALGGTAGRWPTGTRGTERFRGGPRSRRWLLAGAAGVAVGLLVGGGPGAGLAIAVTVGGQRLLRARSADDGRAARAALVRELPAACDLLAVCLAAGVPVAGALAAVGDATPAPLGSELSGIAALYRMGADPRRAWSGVPPELTGVGRVMVRAGESGSTVGPALRALAADSRAAARAATEAAVRRAGIWVLAPLGLCFLPAFVCLGVVPLILGIAGDVFG